VRGTGQVRLVAHWFGAVSTSAIGSVMIPLRTPCSQKSNQRCSVEIHSARRTLNGSVCGPWCSQIFRATPLSARAFHHCTPFLVRTFQSLSPCTRKTLARTLCASLT
jgi:hypothetical protein